MPSSSYPPPQDWGPYSQDWGHQEPEPLPPQAPAPEPPPRDGMGIAALVLGLIALTLFWTVLVGVVLGVLAVVFGLVGHRRAARGEATNGWMALAGAVTGLVGLALSATLIAATLAFLNSDAFDDFRACMRDAPGSTERGQCVEELGDRLW
ncbi:DUF4190 domain-containing protein [Streptomyces sp. TRM43335]|uniref:DUF4190 domain-containing protein n=1 Tax=Streptomyces taklimakanensis TaxID=2569853 RepID=A0A6G2BAS8_9ACTN|nr:DUF4190 domain-containing protein [Streptomyces taklimakanensis]MTE19368.1 DUF4190 domain-containing protein [Streptomyces taklimakanensis]